MAVNIPNGATIAVGSVYGAVKTLSALSNATEGVATLEASHGVIVGDIIVVTSGWSKLNGRVVRAKTVATNDVTLEGVDTSSTTKYPAGSGTGSIKEVTTWTHVTQVLEAATSGGTQNFATYSFLEDNTERQIPTVKTPIVFTMKIADDSTLPHYSVLAAADDDRQSRAIRIILASGAILYYNAYVTLNKTPSLTKDQVMALDVTFSLVADPTRYSS